MTQRRIPATNQLSRVLDALQVGEKTGILTVERGEDETFEEGMIVLVKGRVVNATISPRRGGDTAAALLSWQACRFSYAPVPAGQADAGPTRGPVPAASAETNGTSTHLRDAWNALQQASLAARDHSGCRPCLTVYSHEALQSSLRALDRRGFSRAHRRLFLLIDGRRSTGELAALMSRTLEETMSLLADLRQAGFIQL